MMSPFPHDWQEYTIGDCLRRVERPVEVDPNALYTQIGIRSHGKGLFYKEPVTGESLGNKAVYWIEPDCFVLNIVFAWEQAIGKTTQAEVGMIGSHRFPMYKPVDNLVDIDYLIFYLLTKRGTDILEAASPGGAGRNRTLGQERFLKSKIILPPIEEQRKIAAILATQDKVIELQTRKIEELKRFKQGCLEKMFPRKGQKVPEKRFPGFTGDWEQRKFKDSFDLLSNNTLSRAELDNEQGAAQNVHYGDILVRFGEVIDLQVDALPYITDEANVSKSTLLQNGDIIIADTAEDTTVGKCVEITGISDTGVVAGLHTIPCRPRNQYAQGYLGYFMNSPVFHNQLLPLMQGTKVTSVSKSALQDTVLYSPTDNKEQALISDYFIKLDHLITLHQRKLDEMKKLQKALMKILLTGKVRVNV